MFRYVIRKTTKAPSMTSATFRRLPGNPSACCVATMTSPTTASNLWTSRLPSPRSTSASHWRRKSRRARRSIMTSRTIWSTKFPLRRPPTLWRHFWATKRRWRCRRRRGRAKTSFTPTSTCPPSSPWQPAPRRRSTVTSPSSCSATSCRCRRFPTWKKMTSAVRWCYVIMKEFDIFLLRNIPSFLVFSVEVFFAAAWNK